METIGNNSEEVTSRRAPEAIPSWANEHGVASVEKDVPVVLIVDDVANNLLAFEGMLRRDDIEIVTACSGRVALDILLERDVALALIDVRMPEMDGFELAALMRGVDKTRHVPIIFVTADAREQSRMFKGYDVGAVDYLYKPVDQRILCGKVDVFVTLDKQRRQLLQAERMREMFVGILGHDLRNPLSGILMAAAVLQKRTEDVAVRDMLQRIIRAGDRMARMIEQILDLTRIRVGGGLSQSFAPADLRCIVEQVVGELAEHESPFKIEYVGDTLGSWDADRISQVISNLASNAVQHSPPGTPVLIRVDGSRDNTLQLEVHNAGPGVPSELRDVLFEPFRGRQHAGGLGLGLFVCKQVVLQHGGTIEYESADDSGTCFRITLPRHSAPQSSNALTGDGSAPFAADAQLRESKASPQHKPHRPERGAKILIVDDELAVRDSLKFLLSTVGHQVTAAADGDEAVAMVASSGVPPDLVIIDYNLGNGGTGLEVMTRLREAVGRDLDALILTGDISTGTLRNIALANYAQLSKPVKFEELKQAIQRAVSNGDGPASVSAKFEC